MVFWFNPKITHIADPLAVVHVRALPAEFADEPMDAVRPVISVGEYWSVHCNAAGWVPPAESARLSGHIATRRAGARPQRQAGGLRISERREGKHAQDES